MTLHPERDRHEKGKTFSTIFVAERKNFEAAKQYCKKQGARLFEPRSRTINKLVFDKSVEVFGNNGGTNVAESPLIQNVAL